MAATFSASLDSLAKVITTSVTVLFAGIIVGQYFLGDNAQNAIPIVINFGLVIIYVLSYALSPMSYSVSVDAVYIHRLMGNVRIDKQKVRDVSPVDPNMLRWSIRVFGVGGLFGYYGKFANSKLGTMTWYLSRRDRVVLMLLDDGRKILVSPDDPDRFISECSR